MDYTPTALYKEGLYEAEEQGLSGVEAEAFAKEYVRSIMQEKG